jgi:energy-coupling factor transport system permease protein
MMNFTFKSLSGRKKESQNDIRFDKKHKAMRFIEGDSIIHKIDPRTKFLFVIMFVSMSLITADLPPIAFLSSAMIILLFVSGLVSDWIEMMKKFVPFLILIVLLDTIFPRVSYGELYFSTTIWLLKPMVTYGGLLFSAAMGFRFLNLFGISVLLIMCTRYEDFVKGLRKLKVPYRVSFSLGLALRAINYLSSDIRNIIDAQRSRCLEFDKGNIFNNLNKLLALFIPMTVCLIGRSRNISEAMLSRGFGYTKDPTMYQDIRFSKYDGYFMAFVIFTIISYTFLCLVI